MTCSGLEVDVVIVGVLFRPLIVHRQADIAFPHQIFDHRFGFENLLDTRQLDGFRRLAVGQSDLAVIGGGQRLGLFTVVGVLFDQQFLIALQGLDLFQSMVTAPAYWV
jgi:hypothetical protein